jgi:hypothetical protein
MTARTAKRNGVMDVGVSMKGAQIETRKTSDGVKGHLADPIHCSNERSGACS